MDTADHRIGAAVERLGRRGVRQVFVRGALVWVVAAGGENARGSRLPALLEEWSGKTCRLVLHRSHQRPLPQPGGTIEIIASRCDGICRLPAEVLDLTIHWSDDDGRDRCTLLVRPDGGRAIREQAREGFRLTGDWPAVISLEAEAAGESAADSSPRGVLARVVNLSGTGALVADEAEVLRAGLRFRLTIDLADGEPALVIGAEVLRRDLQAGDLAHHWGCRLIDPTPDQEARILRQLNARMRRRLRGASPAPGTDLASESA